ncbi:MAG TPA: hemerythrin domain-containing protein [Polyangia bacterium]|jgi:hemerythrin-like domain-containing protein|nr:hemerythrin domain-containing protein [Polyangia bacterium]
MTPTRVLIEEHELIEHALAVLDGARQLMMSGGGVPMGTFEKVLAFFHSFAVGCHQAKEEQVLFPLLKGKPIPFVLQERGQEQALLGSMVEALPELCTSAAARSRFAHSAAAYRQLLRHRIAQENAMLQRLESGVLTVEESQDVLQGFSGYQSAQVDSLSSWAAGLERGGL